MAELRHQPVDIDNAFPTVDIVDGLIEEGSLIDPKKVRWEDSNDRISSSYPAAVLNAAMLAGVLNPYLAHELHDTLPPLPDNWYKIQHPDKKITKPIKVSRFQPDIDDNKNSGIADILYQHYGTEGQKNKFSLLRLIYPDIINNITIGGELVGTANKLVDAVLKRTVLVSSIGQHSTTLVRYNGRIVEIDPRNPYRPTPVDTWQIIKTWARRSGTAMNHRILEAIISQSKTSE